MENKQQYFTYINADGWVMSPYIKDADIKLNLTKEQFDKININYAGYNWKYVNGKFKKLKYITTEYLQELRQQECFNFIDNRSKLWYDTLSEEQYAELKEWYQAWLDVTKTEKIPTKPSWLK